MSQPLCEVCDYPLDERGRCADCAGVLPNQIENLKFDFVRWIVCSAHGAQAVGVKERYRLNRVVKKMRGGRQVRHSEWQWRCPKCDLFGNNQVRSYKERIMLPQQAYQPEIDRRLARWGRP